VAEAGTTGAVPTGTLVRKAIFWEFARATWQYDVVVGLILVFIFLTPREWFHDQPKASSVLLMASQHGANRVFIASELLATVPEDRRPAKAEALIRQRTGKSWKVVRVEPIGDDPAGVNGYIAYTAP
jgi:hypothetical protein